MRGRRLRSAPFSMQNSPRYMECMSASCCNDPHRGNPAYRRVLWLVLGINAVMFLVEIGAGLAAGSASLQADALDFLATPATTPSAFSSSG